MIETLTLPPLQLEQYNRMVENLVNQLGGETISLANQTFLFRIGQGSQKIAFLGGVRGDEVSGPLALLTWLENLSFEASRLENKSLWLIPLLNQVGWSRGEPEWYEIDLSQTISNEQPAPPFVAQLREDLLSFAPTVFLNLRENQLSPQLRHGAKRPHPWFTKLTDQFQSLKLLALSHPDPVTEEDFLRRSGHSNCATLTVAKPWSLAQKIDWQMQVFDWCLTHLAEAENIL